MIVTQFPTAHHMLVLAADMQVTGMSFFWESTTEEGLSQFHSPSVWVQ